MRLVIAGYGPVGQAVHYALEHHPAFHSPYIGSQNVEKMKKRDHAVWVDDPHVLKYDGKTYHIVDPTDVGKIDGVIVCVATPMREDGTCNTDHVEEVFTKYGPNVKYLIKSAINPQWLVEQSKKYKITYCPEFLRGSFLHADPIEEFMNQEFLILGGEHCRWWDELFRPCLQKLNQVKYLTLEQACFAKYIANCFLATKVTFFNEMYSLYNSLGFKGFDACVDAIASLDNRIGKSHTQVPGPDGNFGFGGHCFPKDTSALVELGKLYDESMPILSSVRNANTYYKEKLKE